MSPTTRSRAASFAFLLAMICVLAAHRQSHRHQASAEEPLAMPTANCDTTSALDRGCADPQSKQEAGRSKIYDRKWLERRRAAIRTVESLGGWIYYDTQVDREEVTAQIGPPPQTVEEEMAARVVVLGFQPANVSDNDLTILETFPNLRTLVLANTKCGDETLKRVRRLEKLTCLDLSKTPITDNGLEHLESLPDLESLVLEYTAVTDSGMPHVGKLKKLKYLYLSKTKITDRGLMPLKSLRRLEWLKLNDTSVTDAGLRHLSRLEELKVLQVLGTGVTWEGLIRIRRALPGLETCPSGPVQDEFISLPTDGTASHDFKGQATSVPVDDRMTQFETTGDRRSPVGL